MYRTTFTIVNSLNNKVWRGCLCAFVFVSGFVAIAQSPAWLTGKLAYVQDGNIWVRALPEGIPRQMSQGGLADHPQWSASGHWLSFDQTDKVNVIPIEPIRQDTITLETDRSAWSPTLDEIAFVDHGALAVLRLEPVLQQERIIVRKPAQGNITDFAWNPDGTSLAVVTASDDRNRMTRLWYLNANGSNGREISLARPLYKLAGWSADGEHILLWVGGASESIAADGLPLVSVSVTDGDHQLVTEEMLPYKEDEYVAMSPVGNNVLVISGGNREAWTNKRLMTFNTVTGNSMGLGDDSTAVASSTWSPDGEVIAFAAGPNDREAFGGERAKQVLSERRIWIMNADGQQRRRLTTDAQYRDEYPIWSKDGQHLLFMRMDTQNVISVWSVGLYDGTLMKLVDHIMGPAAKDSWFGYYGHVHWPSFVAYYQ